MKMRVIQNRLNPFNCAIILIDFQIHLFLTIDSMDVRTLIQNAVGLAQTAFSLDIPTLLATIGTRSFGGPLLPQIQTIFPGRQPVECATMSVWEDRRVKREVELTHRKKVGRCGTVDRFLRCSFSHPCHPVRV